MTAVLQTKSLSVRYGGVHALSDVDLAVEPGQLVGLIGPNGAGKTTLTDAVTGFASSTGTVELKGEDISGLAPHQRHHRGLARTWQAGEVFDELTVRENLAVAGARASLAETARQLFRGRPTERPEVDEILGLLGLAALADRPADSITQGQRKLVGVGRALASSPSVICLDEPAAGLDTGESEALGRRLREVVARGTGLLLIDHDMGLVLSVCDWLVVLNFGKVIAEGTPAEIRQHPAVVEAYLGDAAKQVEETKQ